MAENKKYSTLLNNTILFAISNFSSKIIGLIIKPYLTFAYADPSVLGVQSLMQQVTNLLIPVVSLGVSFAIIRFGLDKEHDQGQVFTNGLATIALGFFLMLLAYPLVRLIPSAGDYMLLLYLCVLMSCLRTLGTQFIRSRMLNRLVAIDGVMTSATLLGFLLLYLNVFHMGAAGYLLAVLSSDAVSTVFVFLCGRCWRYLDFKRFNARLWGEMLRYCLPMIPASISFWIINASDTFFVNAMCNGTNGLSGTVWVGLLSTGYFMPTLISTAGQIFYEAWQLSAVTEEENRTAFFSRVFRSYASVMFCCTAGVVWLCRPMMHMFQKSFYDAWQFVPFLAMGAMCTCFNLFLNSVFVVYKRSTSSLWTMLAGALLNIVLNYFFIQWFGPIGAASASFIALLLVFILRAYTASGLLRIHYDLTYMTLNFGLILADTWVLYSLKDGPWVLWTTVITGVLLALNVREVLSMARLIFGRFLPRRTRHGG